jgi:hypothetical protein
VRRLLSIALLAAGTIFGPLSVAAGAQDRTPAATVDAFYRWYVAHHGRVEKVWGDARWLLDAELYGEIDQTYYKDDYKANDILVRNCTDIAVQCDVRYDFFSNARSPATSYKIGATRIEGGQANVDVTLHLPNGEGDSHVTAVLQSVGGPYVISNLLFEARGYYYAGPIVDLNKFLGAYNC